MSNIAEVEIREIVEEDDQPVEIMEGEHTDGVENVSVHAPTIAPKDKPLVLEVNAELQKDADTSLDVSNGQGFYVFQSDQSTGQAFVASPARNASQAGNVLTLEQLTPGKLLELQSKGLLQIAVDSPSLLRAQAWIHEPADSVRSPTLSPHEMCTVCGDKASGRHYGARTCEGCKGFFKRSIRKGLIYSCRSSKECNVTKHHRNRCQFCRLQKCLQAGMKVESVQGERSPIVRGNDTVNLERSKVYIGHPQAPMEVQGSLSTLANVVSTIATMNKSSRIEVQTLHDTIKDSNAENVDKEADLDVVLLNLSKTFNSLSSSSQKATAFDFSPTDDTLHPIIDFKGPLMTDVNFSFYLKMPMPLPDQLNVHYICESASRLLFLSAQWARTIFAFQILGSDCNIALLRECWNELFTCGLAQCSEQMRLGAILAAIVQHLHIGLKQAKLTKERVGQVIKHIVNLREFVDDLEKLGLDDREFAYLKVILLLCPDHVRPNRKPQVKKFQAKAVTEFREYEEKVHPEDPERFQSLLLKLPALRGMSGSITEELFFAGLIGNVRIDSIIPYILKMETAEYKLGAEVSADDANTAEDGSPLYVSGDASIPMQSSA